MDFEIYSRPGIQALKSFPVYYVIISISTTLSEPAKLPVGDVNCRGVLRMAFEDTDYELDGAFQDYHAKAVVDFTEQFIRGQPDLEYVLLHCDAGISRSPAVAAAIAVMLGESDKRFFRHYKPNMRVYRKILNEWESRQ